MNHEPVVHQSPSPVHHLHVPIQQRPQMLPDNVQEPARIIEGYKVKQKLATGQYLFNRERQCNEKVYWKCEYYEIHKCSSRLLSI